MSNVIDAAGKDEITDRPTPSFQQANKLFRISAIRLN
jgi:hypothetical protein